jgi:CRISPR/Cas system CSM-associated protein Csm3 (group 7 of RAMP superfamily)
MARKIDSRLILSGKLIAKTPISVGGVGGNVDADLALAVNGQGQFYIPGTSLAGPLRAWLCARVEKQAVASLWGYQEKDEGHASFVLVEDGLVCGKDGKPLDIASSEIRDGVGIDRYSGAASDKAKYNRQILPRGSRIDFKMTVEFEWQDDKDKGKAESENKARIEKTKSLINALRQALQHGEIRFGASKTRGLGRVKLEAGECYEQKLLKRDGLLALLRGEKTPVDWKIEEANRASFSKQSRLIFDIYWKPIGPLMVKAEADGIAVDMLPLVSAVDDQLALVLPGSSIKGAFRNQAERIVRTVRPSVPEQFPTKFHDQIEVELIQDLFGAAGKAKKDDDQALWLPGLGALAVDDCYAEHQIERDEWSAIESATDEKTLREALDGTSLKTAQQAFHVAIDRWLGGAADNMLYTVLEPHGITWEPIRLKLDLARLPQDKQYAAIACTLLVLRDFVAGRIPLGFGTNRGMGAVAVTKIEVKPEGLDETLAKLVLSVKDQKLTISGDALKLLNDAWQKWLKPDTTEEKEAA